MRWFAAMVGAVILAVSVSFTPPAAAATRTVRMRHLLAMIQPEVKFTDVPLADALDFLRDSEDLNMVVDWKSLEAANIDRNTLINVNLHHVTLRKALSVVLNEAGAGNLLTFYSEDGVLEITTQAKADTILYTKVYEVQDLLVSIPNFQLQDVTQAASSLSSGSGNTSLSTQGGAGAGGGGSSSSSNSFSNSGSMQTDQQTPAEAGADLVKLIMSIVRPEIWQENGGNSTIRFYHGLLIVNAPISVHEAIGGPVD
jgi:hypothetical protein